MEVIREDMRMCGLDEDTVLDRGGNIWIAGFNLRGIKIKKIQGE